MQVYWSQNILVGPCNVSYRAVSWFSKEYTVDSVSVTRSAKSFVRHK